MSNTIFDTASDALRVFAPLRDAHIMGQQRSAASKEAGKAVNKSHLTAYAECALIMARYATAGGRITGRQKGGQSPSAALKNSVMEMAKASKISEAKAKRLVEKGAALVLGQKKDKSGIPARPGNPLVVEAANGGEGSVSAILAAFSKAEIEREADILALYSAETDPLVSLAKKVHALSAEDRERLAAMVAELDNTAE